MRNMLGPPGEMTGLDRMSWPNGTIDGNAFISVHRTVEVALKRVSYWGDTVGTQQQTTDAVDIPAHTDVAIVGAGLTGLSAALALARHGAEVAVLEAHHAGWGASSRNGGMVLSGMKRGPSELVSRFGLEEARRLDAVSIHAIDFVERLVREESIACDFTRSGHLALASKPAHYEHFKRDAAIANERFGRVVRLLSREKLGAEIGAESYFGAIVDDASAGVNPAKLVLGLARSARRAGVTLCEQAPVEHIHHVARGNHSRFSVRTPRRDVLASHVIVATGAYTGRESPWLRRRIIPIGSYIIATEPLPETVAREISPRYRMMYDSKHFLHYFRLTPDRRMLFGGRASFVPESERAISESAEILRRDMIALFPQLRDVTIEYAWGGTIDFTADMLPHAGAIDGVHYAAGYAGHGVALAIYLGAQLAAMIAGDTKDAGEDNPLLCRTFPAPALGAHRVPGALASVGAWYRFLDMVS
jgi:glycine/D-amino acid oxidase-like deaminating enzyme